MVVCCLQRDFIHNTLAFLGDCRLFPAIAVSCQSALARVACFSDHEPDVHAIFPRRTVSPEDSIVENGVSSSECPYSE